MVNKRIDKQPNKGFTLVELMIVVLVMAIFIGIAIPLFSHSQEKASETACFTSQKIINQASHKWRMEKGTSEQLFPRDVQQLVDDGYLLDVPSCGGHPYTQIDGASGLTACPNDGRHVLQ